MELRLPTWEGEAPAESRLRRSVALPKQNPNDRNIHAIATLAPPSSFHVMSVGLDRPSGRENSGLLPNLGMARKISKLMSRFLPGFRLVHQANPFLRQLCAVLGPKTAVFV